MSTGCGPFSQIERDVDASAVMRYAQTGDLQTEVGDLAQPLIDQGRTPGFVVGVLLPDGSEKYFGAGVTRKDNGHRPDEDTLFAIGSTSKGFLGATVARLVKEGRLAWDDTLENLLPDHISLSSDAREITLLQLATHSSGLPRQPFTARTAIYFMQYLFTGKNFYRHFDRDYLLNYLEDFNAPADTAQRYSNVGYGILGYVTELRTGKKLETLMREKLLHPLQLNATGYEPEKLPGYDDRARAYSGDHPKFIRRGQPVPEWRFTEIMLGAAGLYSTAGDLLTYARAHLHPGNDELLNRALQDTLKVRIHRSEPARALAWAVDDVDGHEITYQIGFVSGFSSYIGMDTANKTAVVVLQNSLNWTESIGHRLLLLMARAALIAGEDEPFKKP